MSLATELNELLHNLSNKAKASAYNGVEDVLRHYNDQYRVAVTLTLTPTSANVTIKNGSGSVIPKAEDGKYYMDVGTYTYTATAAGYTDGSGSIEITSSDKTSGKKTVAITLTAAQA